MKYHIISSMTFKDGSMVIYYGFVEFLLELLFMRHKRERLERWEITREYGYSEVVK